MVNRQIGNLYHSEIFQGRGKKPPYFEGWYFKAVSPGGRVLALIPGISLSEAGSHSFIQVIDSYNDAEPTRYYSYPAEAFVASSREMMFCVGESFFSKDVVRLQIEGPKAIAGRLRFTSAVPLDRSFYSPGIMGPFGYLPVLGCRHGVVTAWARAGGSITIGGETVNFDGGTGYIEKDWGESFPEAYFWVQSCSFGDRPASFMLSAARLAVLGRPFNGFIAFLYANGRFYRFATYTASKLDTLREDADGLIELGLHDERYALHAMVKKGRPGILLAPEKGGMSRQVRECVNGSLHLTLRTRAGRVIFDGEAAEAGVEVSGDVHKLL